jgi:hypothetical protein
VYSLPSGVMALIIDRCSQNGYRSTGVCLRGA